MALVFNKADLARHLREGIRIHAATLRVTVLRAEEELSSQLRIDHRRLVSWTRPSSVPSEIADDLLLGLIWLLLQRGNASLRWLFDVLSSTSIVVVEPPSPEWFRACFRHVRFDGKPIPPLLIQQQAAEMFAREVSEVPKLVRSTTSSTLLREGPTAYEADASLLPTPYVIGVPVLHVRQFYGRHIELKRIFDAIGRSPLQNVAIIGPRASGKTSLLHHVQQIATAGESERRAGQRVEWLANAARYQWVRINFRDPRMQSKPRLLKHLLMSLDLTVPKPLDLGSFMDVFCSEFDSRKPAVILMDEVDAGLAAADLDMPFWWTMRSMSSHASNGGLGFIITLSAPPAELARNYGKPSPFFNIFGHALKLGPLDESSARELILSSGMRISEDDVLWIIEQSRGWPASVQLLSDIRYRTLLSNTSAWRQAALSELQHTRSSASRTADAPHLPPQHDHDEPS